MENIKPFPIFVSSLSLSALFSIYKNRKFIYKFIKNLKFKYPFSLFFKY